MTAKRWQMVGGYALALTSLTIYVVATPSHSIWSWWTALGAVVFLVSYEAGSHVVREWQAAGPDRGRRYDDQ